MSRIVNLILTVFVLVFSGCVTTPAINDNRLAVGVLHDHHQVVMKGKKFHHLVRSNGQRGGSIVSFIIHGDGLPWLAPGKIALDPTTEHEPSFAIWRVTAGAAYFLGRPCYFQVQDPVCHPGHWTNARYATEVVDSLAALVKQLSESHPNGTVRLVGYSGGGVLATLLAHRLASWAEQTYKGIDLVTFAAPLDIGAWTQHHRFSDLNLSLNPATFGGLGSVRRKHYYGADDKNVPTQLVQAYFANRKDVDALVIEGFNHRCCWQNLWRDQQVSKLAD